MKILIQLAIIFAVCLCGEGVSGILPVTIPGSVISMILLFILLLARVIRAEQIEETGDFFLKNMGFFFIPAGVAIMDYFDLLKANLFPFLAVVTLTTIITFGVTSWTVIGVMRLQSKLRGGKKDE